MTPKGTIPKPRNWIVCDIAQFKGALSSMRESGMVLIQQRIGAHTTWYHNNVRVARSYENKGDGQHLIAASLSEHIPSARNDTQSIYEGGNLS